MNFNYNDRMKIFLFVFILTLSPMVFANCAEVLYGTNRWYFENGKWKNIELIKKASKAGCNYNQQLKCDRTNVNVGALSCAVATGHPEVVKELIQAGADVNAKDKAGETPLSYALKSENINAVRFLLEAGAEYSEILKKVSNGNFKAENTSLYAVATYLFKENENFDSCKYSYEQISNMFFIAQAMYKESSNDIKLQLFLKQIKKISTQEGYEKNLANCNQAKTPSAGNAVGTK